MQFYCLQNLTLQMHPPLANISAKNKSLLMFGQNSLRTLLNDDYQTFYVVGLDSNGQNRISRKAKAIARFVFYIHEYI